MEEQESSRRVVYSHTQSMSPPRLQEQRAESRSPPRLSVQRAQSKSPKRMGFSRTQSKSPPRLREQRAESKSPPRLAEGRTQSKSPTRLREQRAESKSPPRLAEGRAQSKSPPRPGHQSSPGHPSSPGHESRLGHQSRPKSKYTLCQVEENMDEMAFPQHPGDHRDSRDPQSTGSEGTHNSGRIRRKHRRATPTPLQRRAPAESILHAACWAGNMASVKRILSQGQSDINSEGGLWRETPVMNAAWHGHVDVVELLVGKGADVSLVDVGGDNILHCACYGGDFETVKFVLSGKMADINSRGEGGRTPVMAATWYGHTEVVELLMNESADVSLADDDGDNILHWACEGGNVDMVKFVLSLNVVDINSRGKESRTPVTEAAQYGRREVVELLVREGADVSQVDGVGNNILHLACEGGDVATVTFVLSLKVVDISARNKTGQTAADVARSKGHLRLVELLESRGAE